MAIVTAIPASPARVRAVGMIFFAPAALRRFESATYMGLLLNIYISACPFLTSSTSSLRPTTSAFRATGLPAMLEHLKREGVPFTQCRASGQALIQLSSTTPTDQDRAE